MIIGKLWSFCLVTDEIKELVNEALEHLNHGRSRMALTSAVRAYNETPDDPKAAICLAWATLENGNPKRALELADLSVKSDNFKSESKLYRAYFLIRMGIYAGALEDLNSVKNADGEMLTWKLLNISRALAGLGKFNESLEEINKIQAFDKAEKTKINQIKEWIKICKDYKPETYFTSRKNNIPLLEEAEESFNKKEFWFTIWASEIIGKNSLLKKEKETASLLKLESLAATFQYRNAYEEASQLKNKLSDNQAFQKLYKKITFSYNQTDENIKSVNETSKTSFEILDDSDFKIIHAKTYDVLDNLRSKRRTYLLKFNEENIRYIGIEVVVKNPFYGKRTLEVKGKAIWYLNDKEVGRNNFILNLHKEWRMVEFVQSWGTEVPGFWNRGQGKVEIHLTGKPVFSRWFLVGNSESVNFEKTDEFDIPKEDTDRPKTEQPFSVVDASNKMSEDQPLEELMSELNEYIGLGKVKQSMKDFIDYLQFVNERKRLGLQEDEKTSFNCIFLGKPGTGKTSIARLLGKIFKSIGLLKNGHVIEVDRAALVGQYIGETAQKTEKVIKEALGGLLFIDEAYTLVKNNNGQDFGNEALEILLKRMEDNNGEFAVIAAGYPDQMTSFINSNPGLKSRFNHIFYFDDYNPDELAKIFNLIASKENYSLDEDALNLLKSKFTNNYKNRDSSFGNARLVRNYFNEAKVNLSKRCLKYPKDVRTKKLLTTITKDDLELTLGSSSDSNYQFKIDNEALNELLKKVNDLVGLKNVKEEITEIVKLAKFYSDQNENLYEKFNSHFVFVGNPGTGKTTVARLFSQIYNALGILPKGHLVEVDRQSLVGGYVGQTAIKTSALIDKAIGGTLFIDEAYSLTKKSSGDDFGSEVIDTLIKRMEDDRGKFLVIAAGYTNEMNQFLNSNPGIKSRFSKLITFEDYSPDELFEIADNQIKSKNHLLDVTVKEQLKKYFNKVYRNRDKNFGNARFIRTAVEDTLKNHLLRIADIPSSKRTEKEIQTIRIDDIKDLIFSKKQKENVTSEGDQELLNQYLDELNSLAGIDSVKKQVNKLITSLKVAKIRRSRGMNVMTKNLHSVFVGNPGTGKTVVARLLSKIFREMGLLEKGHLVEVDRSALVAGYEGQTSAKTISIIEKAIGGTLFIDEAYTLSKGSLDFGNEAIETLIKKMEDYQDKLIVIAAGPPDEMKEFLNSNPGLQSRFGNNFTFNDFTPREMLEIALHISEENGYVLDEGAWQLMLDLCSVLYNYRDKNFGNARTVRNILYKAISNQEERLLTLADIKDEDLVTITINDVEKIDFNEL